MPAAICTVREQVAYITLNRPEALNALNREMIDDLRRITADLLVTPDLRAVVIDGAGDHFMAGGDLKWFQAQLQVPPRQRQPQFEALLSDVHATILQLKRCRAPVVAVVQGAVAGFGLSLMLAADLAIAADSAYFTLAYRHVGLTPDGGATWSLPRLVGLRRAMEIALLGDRFDAATALEYGLINRVVPAADLLAEREKLVRRLAGGPPDALAQTKALLVRSFGQSLEEQLYSEQQAFAAAAVNPDFAEGLSAFFEKRPPRFGVS